MVKLIGLGGLPGAGKSTAAKYLRDKHGFEIRSFATPLRQEVQDAIQNYNLVLGRPDLPQEVRDALCAIAPNRASEVWHKPTPPDIRRLLQVWGTEYRRAQDPNYWVKRMRLYPGDIVIDDTRFDNEVGLITLLGGEIWNITGRKAATGAPAHASDVDLCHVADITIVNDTDLIDDLYFGIDLALKEYHSA